MKVRVGIVGLSEAWETRHRPALRALSDRFEIRAVCTDVAQRGETAAREFDACSLDGFRSLAHREDVDAVLILATTWRGALPILAACDAGKAVYSSAALDIEPEHALRVKQRVEATGVAFMAEFPRRHAPATLRLKELIATRLGAPRLVFCHRRLPSETANGRKPFQPFSLATKEMMELVDWCRYVIGDEPRSVFGVEQKNHNTQQPNESSSLCHNYQMVSLEFGKSTDQGCGTSSANQLRQLHAQTMARCHFVSCSGCNAGGLRERRCIH